MAKLTMDSFPPHALDGLYKYLRVLVVPDHPQVVIVALNRPSKHNCLNRVLWREIGGVFSQLGTLGDDCRVIVLTAIGKSFCAGIDLNEPFFFTRLPDVAHTGLVMASKVKDMQESFTAIERCPVPVIAAISGNCIGAGIDMVCCADIRLCDSSSVFSVREVQLGLAADVGTLQRLPKIIGNQSTVREICYTGRDFDAAEAFQMGLVSFCSPSDVLQDAIGLAAAIAQHSPVAVRGTKASLLYARDHSIEDGLQHIRLFNAAALQGNDIVIGMDARKKKRPPKYNSIRKLSRL